jgi:hypothetical protein
MQESHICRSVANMPAGPETALSWIIREVLAEPQPVAAWVVHVIGIRTSDDRDLTITLRDDGIYCERPYPSIPKGRPAG